MADQRSIVRRLAGLGACAMVSAVGLDGARVAAQKPSSAAHSDAGDLRLHGLVEAVDFFSVVSPSGANGRLTIVRIAPKGTTVEKGDVVLELSLIHI